MKEETVKAIYNGQIIDFVVNIPEEEKEKNENSNQKENKDNNE